MKMMRVCVSYPPTGEKKTLLLVPQIDSVLRRNRYQKLFHASLLNGKLFADLNFFSYPIHLVKGVCIKTYFILNIPRSFSYSIVFDP